MAALPLPDDAPCWAGPWQPASAAEQLWLLAVMSRTGRRVTDWTARLGEAPRPRGCDPGFAVLSTQARDPRLGAGAPDGPDEGVGSVLDALPSGVGRVATDLVAAAAGALVATATDAVDDLATGPAPRWVGALTRLCGAWLPDLQMAPRAGLVDPAPSWSTESLAFNRRFVVRAEDPRCAADVLAPHVIALLLDRVPADATVTVSGDAVHLWWPYSPTCSRSSGLVAYAVRTVRDLADAIPGFVLTDHPDRSAVVEDRLDALARNGEEYRRTRQPGRSDDPVMQRIYDQARAAAGLVAGPSPSDGGGRI